MATLEQVYASGQSIWVDHLRRALIESGELKELLALGVRGVKFSLPVLARVLRGGSDYDLALEKLLGNRGDVGGAGEQLIREDVQMAADMLLPIYEDSEGRDGFVTWISPWGAGGDGLVAEALRVRGLLGRPNVMCEVGAVDANLLVVERLAQAGVPVCAELAFSPGQVQLLAEAYMRGLEARLAAGGELAGVALVAAVAVSKVWMALASRVGRGLDAAIEADAGIQVCQLLHESWQQVGRSRRWQGLAAKGAPTPRVMWTDIGVSDPLLPDTACLDALIRPNTIAALDTPTLWSLANRPRVKPRRQASSQEVGKLRPRLEGAGLDLADLGAQLRAQEVRHLKEREKEVLAALTQKMADLAAGRRPVVWHLGQREPEVRQAIAAAEQARVVPRIWARDHRVWKDEPTEISNRLGWLSIPDKMRLRLPALEAFGADLRAQGYTAALVLGMGGSSLAPEVMAKAFPDRALDLAILDSTDPGAVLHWVRKLQLESTLFVVATKSGGTVETLSLFKFFYNQLLERLGPERAGAHFLAITDPGSSLERLAADLGFRACFLNDPNIGGRYSALSLFGLVPAALMGIDLRLLLERAAEAQSQAASCVRAAAGNYALQLGAAMGELASRGVDKVTLACTPGLSNLADWIEQLLAESTGKEGKGIVPVVGEPLGPPGVYGNDRFFAFLRLRGDEESDGERDLLVAAGQPLAVIELRDVYDLGAQFFLWEMATAVAGSCLGINPFDQPDVEAAKAQARKLVAAFKQEGKLPLAAPIFDDGEVAVYGDGDYTGVESALFEFLEQARPGDYVAFQAYLQPGAETDAALRLLRTAVRDRLRVATMVGYGPRFLHSTGQLHKGDGGRGLFVQFTAEDQEDVMIPDEPGSRTASLSFGTLKMAQALGDAEALRAKGRRLLRFHFRFAASRGLRRLADAFASGGSDAL